MTQSITLIAAVASESRAIGNDNELLFDIPEDMQRFKEMTTGNIVVMGRKTYESIGRPLPNRTNIVLSRSTEAIDGCTVVDSIDALFDILRWTDPDIEVYVIGGGEIYNQFMPHADFIELTEVKSDVRGDTRFPKIDRKVWEVVTHESGNDPEYQIKYVTFRRV